MGTETFNKRGKTGKRPSKGDSYPAKEARLSHPGAKKACPGAPGPAERELFGLYRKTELGESQYPTEPKGGFADDTFGLPMRGRY